MCLISECREPQDVMSAEDPSVSTVSSSAHHGGSQASSPLPTNAISLTTSTPQSAKNESNSKIKESSSNLSLPVSESTESELNLKGRPEDTVSLESEGGELKKENAQSAFEITSVIEQGDLDNEDIENSSMLTSRQPASMDDSQMKLAESEEDSISLSEDQRIAAASSSGQGERPAPIAEGVTSTDGPFTSVTQTQPLNSTSPLSSNSLGDTSKSLLLSQQSVAVGTGNGPSVNPGPSRFRRVNHYIRGRWKVRDTESTEERSDADPLKGLPSNSSAFSSPSSKRRSEDGLQSQSASELGTLSDTVSDRDAPFDRSSIAAEGSLSRTTSASSLVQDKSVDGDEQPPELTDESTATSLAGSSVVLTLKDRDSPETVVVSQPSVAEPNPSNTVHDQHSTVPPSGGHPPNGPLEPLTESETSEKQQTSRDPSLVKQRLDQAPRKIQDAMNYLQNELQSLLSVEQKNQLLKKSNDELKEENKRLLTENTLLRQEIEKLKAAALEKR